MEQYSNRAGRLSRSSEERPIFIRRSIVAQQITSHPKRVNRRSIGAPTRIAVIPKRSLNMQNGIPIVKLRKNGRWKNLWIASDSFSHAHLSLLCISGDMVSVKTESIF